MKTCAYTGPDTWWVSVDADWFKWSLSLSKFLLDRHSTRSGELWWVAKGTSQSMTGHESQDRLCCAAVTNEPWNLSGFTPQRFVSCSHNLAKADWQGFCSTKSLEILDIRSIIFNRWLPWLCLQGQKRAGGLCTGSQMLWLWSDRLHLCSQPISQS